MSIAAIPADVVTILAALFLLLGVPAILFAVVLLYTGYVRYDAEQYLEALEELEDEDEQHAPEESENR
ncbi:hypothetical protein [Natrarchaeobaculum sulfurireducens]|uniref:Uncharacterized protein n=1 Tax=Natrarchaeobaculum sulfurireducens TaxID=2044521 RepID=A0A346PCX6_9EURY|nr:hypothetical protein [Natrarchaeobaculum sulfurireducens]AXR77371.1 hypothetical protein AArc1_1030 [Natrarchaeobaculum sulfurireducens]